MNHPRSFCVGFALLTLVSCSTTYINPTVDPDPNPPTAELDIPQKYFRDVGSNQSAAEYRPVQLLARVIFSEAMDLKTLPNSIQLLDDQNKAVDIQLVFKSALYNYRASTTVEVTPSAPLGYGKNYTLKVLSPATDLTGQKLQAAQAQTFQTEKSPFRLFLQKALYQFNAGDPKFTLVLENRQDQKAEKLLFLTECQGGDSKIHFRIQVPEILAKQTLTLEATPFQGENIAQARQMTCTTYGYAITQDRDVVLEE